jgi:ferric-dicitrate binding protein FerR (iron transport regulator)
MKPKTKFEDRLLNNLGTYQSIDSEEDWQKVRKRMAKEKSIKLNPLWRIAAAVILLLGMGFVAQKFLSSKPEMIAVFAGDQMKEVQLPDGSWVTLNRQAELVYPEKFKGRQRALNVSGEAFFKVVSDPASPFVVNVDQKALVRVLGTSFNISPDESGESISVQVVEGRVAFASAEGRDEVILEKDQQATLMGGTVKKDESVERNFLSWKTGKLVFDNDLIGEVLKQLEMHYHVTIEPDESVPQELSFTSTMDNQELGDVLDEISLVLGLDYRYESEKVVFTLSQ